ncbi:MAG: esterase-like activity of phytase family protein [Xanthobacteraceae bacterium]|uniref:esterase-like activity of phytase family protein n=1 Tax=Pseudolabrys sp. TaxID=1960880 RepID=UPI003D0C5389
MTHAPATFRLVLAFAGALWLAGFSAAPAFAQSIRFPAAPTRIVVNTTPIESFDLRDAARTRFGALEFRGGFAMTSVHRAFGGISGIRVASDGASFVAITDRGGWLTGRIEYRNGRPAGIADAQLAPLLAADGQPLAAQGWFDAESIARDGDSVYVGFERVHKIVKFDFGRHGVAARGEPIMVPPDFKSLGFNRGLECLAAVPAGAAHHAGKLIAVSEASLDARGNIRAFILRGRDVAHFAVARRDNFDVSDCALLAPSSLLLLERRFTRATGLAIRVRRLSLSAFRNGAVADGPVLFEADLGYQIDNLEGLAVHRNAQGETILTLVSDDNFSVIQRSILLQFALVKP